MPGVSQDSLRFRESRPHALFGAALRRLELLDAPESVRVWNVDAEHRAGVALRQESEKRVGGDDAAAALAELIHEADQVVRRELEMLPQQIAGAEAHDVDAFAIHDREDLVHRRVLMGSARNSVGIVRVEPLWKKERRTPRDLLLAEQQ